MGLLFRDRESVQWRYHRGEYPFPAVGKCPECNAKLLPDGTVQAQTEEGDR